MFSVRTILHPTDLSESTESAYQVACDLARQQGADLIAVRITRDGGVSYVEKMSELSTELARTALWNVIGKPGNEGDVGQAEALEEGDPIREIVRIAEATHSDLIVMGTQVRTGLTSEFVAGTAEEMIREAPCPVMIVRPADGEQQPASQHVSDLMESAQV